MKNVSENRYKFNKEERKYDRYILDHIHNVQIVYNCFYESNFMKISLPEDTLNLLHENVAKHDISKYSEEEFYGYAQWFYPKEGENKEYDAFLSAWNHHIHNNPHHWEYWVIPNYKGDIALEMPIEYILEMLIDWTAMSLQHNNVPSEWYVNRKNNMFLHKNTIDVIEKHICIFDDIYYEMMLVQDQAKKDEEEYFRKEGGNNECAG